MSVTFIVYCHGCKVTAPEIGDGGHLGYPSAVTAVRKKDGLLSFGYFYQGFAAMDIRPYELEAFHGFVTEHARHRVRMITDADEDVQP